MPRTSVTGVERMASTRAEGGIPGSRLTSLLRELEGRGSLRAAARSLGMDPGNALRLIRTSERRLGLALVEGVAGGRGGGRSGLTKAGRRVARRRAEPGPPPNTRWQGVLVPPTRRGVPLKVWVGSAGVQVQVAALAPPLPLPGSSSSRVIELELEIPPSAVTLLEPSRTPLKTSARNVWRGRVTRTAPLPGWGIRLVEVAVASARLTATLTPSAVRELGLGVGSEVLVQVKATALRLRPRPR